MFFLEPSSPSICHYMMVMSCLGFLIGWALFTRSAWTVQLKSGFEREREISGDSSVAPMLLYYFSTSSDFNLSQSDQKSQKYVSVSERWKIDFFYGRVFSHSVDLRNKDMLHKCRIFYSLKCLTAFCSWKAFPQRCNLYYKVSSDTWQENVIVIDKVQNNVRN